MSNLTINYNRNFMAVIGGLTWFALIGQFYLIIVNRTVTIPETVLRYFSFFTILTNLSIAISVSILLVGPNSKWGRFFSKPSTLTAISVYITVVALTYNAILRFLWAPQGFQRIVDELLHLIVPLLFLIFWAVSVPKHSLQWKMILSWLVYPMVYVVWTIVHGAFSGFYPYPFVDVTKLGYGAVAINGAMMMCGFVILSAIAILIGKSRRIERA